MLYRWNLLKFKTGLNGNTEGRIEVKKYLFIKIFVNMIWKKNSNLKSLVYGKIKKKSRVNFKSSLSYSNNTEIFFENILKNKINKNLKIEIEKITNEDKAYIAGFLDGDGSLLTQIVKGSYKYGFTIRYTIQFVQSKKNHSIMLWLKSRLQVGNIRIRNDNISEYAITGKYVVALIIKVLLPYLKIKKELGYLILKIIKENLTVLNKNDFINVCILVDSTLNYTYGKKRKINSLIVKQYFNSP